MIRSGSEGLRFVPICSTISLMPGDVVFVLLPSSTHRLILLLLLRIILPLMRVLLLIKSDNFHIIVFVCRSISNGTSLSYFHHIICLKLQLQLLLVHLLIVDGWQILLELVLARQTAVLIVSCCLWPATACF